MRTGTDIARTVVIHDYMGDTPLPLGRQQRYGNDPHRNFLRLEHFDPAIKRGHLIALGNSSLDRRTFEVLSNKRRNGSWWAELASVKPPLYVAGQAL